MVHLITGYKGYEHIKSADQGRFNSSFFGASEYVTESGNQCKAQYIDNNTVRILDGDILMQGRHISIEPNSYEDLIIATGTAGYKRADLIVMTYTESETDGIEDAYLEVIKGTETTGTATLPSYTKGNILEGATFNQMPLYRVDINGVTLSQTITPLFKTIPTYATLAERYEQEFIRACQNHLNSLNILDSITEVLSNTTTNQLVGALALKEYDSDIGKQITLKADNNHDHDDMYYRKGTVDGLLSNKSNYNHTHDDRYYTETEVDTKLEQKLDGSVYGREKATYLANKEEVNALFDDLLVKKTFSGTPSGGNVNFDVTLSGYTALGIVGYSSNTQGQYPYYVGMTSATNALLQYPSGTEGTKYVTILYAKNMAV